MKLISFVTQKGGSGKTTLCINYAVAAAGVRKRRVVIFDMDNQASAENWYQEREADTPQLVTVTAAELPKAIEIAAKQFDFVFIDTPGRDEPAQASAIMQSDFCIIPCRPSPTDLQATPATVATVKRLNKPFAFVLTQTPARSFRIAEASAALGRMGGVCPVPIVSRNAYQDAQGLGLGVIEYEPNGRAAEETAKAWKWLSAKLKG
jgi:chromosome partitioning protein